MATLSDEAINTAENTSDDEFEPLPVGVYHARLMEVDTSREGAAGPYWSFQYDIVDPDKYGNRKVWDNVSLSAKAAFKRKQVWGAFGVPLTTDTEDMLGDVVMLVIGHRTIQKGAREGQTAEQVSMTKPPNPEVVARIAAVKGSGASSEDLF